MKRIRVMCVVVLILALLSSNVWGDETTCEIKSLSNDSNDSNDVKFSIGEEQSFNWNNFHENPYDLNDVTFGKGRYVAVGEGGVIYISDNASDWTKIILENISWNIEGIIFDGNNFIGVGGIEDKNTQESKGCILSSPDGLEWKIIKTDIKGLNDIKFNGKQYVTVGEEGHIYASKDGKEWTEANSPASEDFNCVLWTDSKWIVGGYSSRYIGNEKKSQNVIISEDGIQWRLGTAQERRSITDMFWDGTNIIATTNGNSFHLSRDGITWEDHFINIEPYIEDLYTVTKKDDTYILIGRDSMHNASVLLTKDFTNYQTQTIEFDKPNKVKLLNDQLVIVGKEGIIYTSKNGENWVKSQGSPLTSKYGLKCVEYGKNGFITVGYSLFSYSDHIIIETKDGVDRKITKIPGNKMSITTDMVEHDDKLIGVTEHGKIYDLRNVKLLKEVEDKYLRKIIWTGKEYIAVGGSRGSNNVIVRSTDGVNWESTSVNNDIMFLNGVAYSGDLYVVCGSRGYIAASKDGKTWTDIESTITDELRDVQWLGDKFVAVGDSGRVAYSKDGYNWNSVKTQVNKTLWRIGWNGNTHIACGESGTILTSRDLKNWSEVDVRLDDFFYDVEWKDNKFFVAGGVINGKIMIGELKEEATPDTLKKFEKSLKYDIIEKDDLNDINKIITREELCKYIIKAYEASQDTSIKTAPQETFYDTNNEAVLKAKQLGVIDGVRAKMFKPYNQVTQEQFCVILANMMNKINTEKSATLQETSTPTEKAISSWAKKSVMILDAKGIIDVNSSEFIPNEPMTKAQAIRLITEAIEVLK